MFNTIVRSTGGGNDLWNPTRCLVTVALSVKSARMVKRRAAGFETVPVHVYYLVYGSVPPTFFKNT